jgi:hypothetical protein
MYNKVKEKFQSKFKFDSFSGENNKYSRRLNVVNRQTLSIEIYRVSTQILVKITSILFDLHATMMKFSICIIQTKEHAMCLSDAKLLS